MTKPIIFAHRGASAYAPENTLPAFQKAIDMKADGIELDIQLTKDGKIVVIHDERIDRTSTGKGWVKDYTFDELREFQFNTLHPEYENVTIPTIQEVFELIKPSNLSVNIELKTGIFQYKDLEEMIVQVVKEYELEDRVIYSSFHHPSMMTIKQLNPNYYIGLLTRDGFLDIPSYAKAIGANAINPALYQLQYPDFVTDCKKYGIDLNVWTVDEPEYIKQCIALEVHSIISNKPDLVRQIMEGIENG